MFILAMPAGREMNVRTTGSILEKKTALMPCFSNHISALSRSLLCIRKYLPYFSINHLPPLLPIRKRAMEPAKFASVATQTTPQRENLPAMTRNPEKGMTTSEGIGIAALSSADKTKIPEYPVSLMTAKAHSLI